MSRPGERPLQRARQLLAFEDASSGSAGGNAAADSRVYDKLKARLAPLVGAAGVQMLFARSAKLVRDEFPFLAAGCVDDSAKLSACLQAQDPAVAREAATALFATFLALLTTFIGERLTNQLLRTVWPAIEGLVPGEKKA
jgi:hypothetical protein